MKKFLIAMFMLFVIAVPVTAAIETYEGTDDYYVLGAVEDLNVARERAREKAIRAARESAGVYIHSFSRMTNMNVEDEVISVASGVLRVLDTAYEVIELADSNGYVVRAHVKAEIDTSDLEKFLQKDAEEMSKIVAADRITRQQEAQQDLRIATLKEQYLQAGTAAVKATIAKQIVEEDKVFLSNKKLREGNKYRDEGNHKQAAELFTKAIELNPNNFIAWNNRGWAYAEQKKFAEAMADFNRAEQINPDSELPYMGRGWVYNQQRDFNAAIREYDKVILLNPNYAVAWNNRGAAKSWLKQMTAAIADYNKAIELSPRYAKAYENRGRAFAALGEDEKSAADLQRANKITRSNREVDKIILETIELNKYGDYDKALELFNQAAENYPDNPFVFVNRGNIYNDKFRDYDAAIADYNKTIEINPKFSWPYHNRALAYGRLKRWDEALADYGRAIELDKNYASAYNGRAWSYCQIGRFEEALVDANKAVELMPNEANFYDTRAMAYEGLKNFDAALADMNTAIKISQEGWLYNRRGEVYRAMGNDAKAQADFKKAKQLGYRN